MNILCVCGLGLGASLILKMNVIHALFRLGIEANVENTSVSKAQEKNPDYIIISSELTQILASHPSKTIVVYNYFDINEIIESLANEFKKGEN